MLNPTRLSLARRRRGLTKKRLAEAVGLSVRSLTAYEAGDQVPSEATLGVIARALMFPVGFFVGEDLEEISDASASFRALSRMTASQRDSALAAGTLARRFGRWIEERYELPEPSVPNLDEFNEPEVVAQHVRLAWGLGERPISNMVHLMELHGVCVFSLVEECREVDAFSLWDGARPYVFLNTQKSAERSRFDAAHELGHLVMHQHGSPTGREAEEQANAFAGAFLMPRAAVIARAPNNPSLRSILEGREIWSVSAVAYAHRLHKVGILSDWYYHEMARKLSAMGMRSEEKGSSLGRESSQSLRRIFDDLRSSGVTRAEVARQLDLYPEELDRLVFGLLMTGIPGDSEGGTPAPTRNHLRLVK
ncbi:MAG: XRE family transcriptional regulator [Thermoanaerobaculia bacterium]